MRGSTTACKVNPSRLRVAYLYQSRMGGRVGTAAPVHVYHIVKGLQDVGHEATLVALHGTGEVLCTGDIEAIFRGEISGQHLGRQSKTGRTSFRLLERGLRRLQATLGLPYLALFDSLRLADGVQTNLPRGGYQLIHERQNLNCWGGLLASRRLKVPLLLEVNADPVSELDFQGRPLSRFSRWYGEALLARSLATAQTIVCVSEDLKQHLIAVRGVDSRKIEVLPNAADTERMGGTHDVVSLRHRHDLGTGPVVVFVGGFYAWHDVPLLVEAFADLMERHPSAKLVLVGDGAGRQALEAAVAAHGASSSVVFTGRLDHDGVPAMLSLADIAVAPLKQQVPGYGGSPLKLYEYMAAGKAIIASRVGQMRQVITDDHNGLLTEPGDSVGLTRALDRLLSDSTLRRRLGSQARQDAIEKHSWRQYTRRLEMIYRRAIDQGREPVREHLRGDTDTW